MSTHHAETPTTTPTLAEATATLHRIIGIVESDLDEVMAASWHTGPREKMRDDSGRYILLDAYASLVVGLAAMEGHR